MWTLDSDSPIPVWQPASPAGGVLLTFTTRRGGVSARPFDTLNLGRSTDDHADAVAENRLRLLDSIGLDPQRLATAGQVHGATVSQAKLPGHLVGCDALVSTTPGLVLAVTTADCLPLLYSAPGAVAAAHCGWRGTADAMPLAALRALCTAARCTPDRVHVHFGPCIRACCYQVGPEVASRFPPEALTTDGERWRLDLAAVARLQLLEAGVLPPHLHDTRACTACAPTWYFSHRRDAGRTGRHWGIAALLEARSPSGERAP